MRKFFYTAMFVVPFVIGGCGFKITPTMCDKIRSDPNALLPQECRAYDKKEADKAFNNTHSDQNDTNEVNFIKVKDAK